MGLQTGKHSVEMLPNQILQGAISRGVVSLFPGDYDFDQYQLGRAARSIPESKNLHRSGQFESLTNPISARWAEHSFAPIEQPDTGLYWAVEVARIGVPRGESGLLRGLEQVLYDADGNYYATSSAYWGSPYSVVDDLRRTRWYLQVSPFTGIQPPRVNFQSAVQIPRLSLPGTPYTEIPNIEGLFYAAQSGGTRVKTVIPSGQILRLFFTSFFTIDYHWVVGGRLQMQIQTGFSQESEQNIRRTI